ncbi:hypothetical protein [Methanoregula sp.]|uniref:hypothetical protein n=1 Tax=Methanoregula sp. TaxID=2052170 RepID=UPI003568EEF2
MRPIYKKTGYILLGVIILLAILGVGCLGPGQQPGQPNSASVKCPVSLESGQNLIINETQNNATICAGLNSSILIRLPDVSRTGHTWIITGSPGLQIYDEGVTWYDEKGTPPISLIEYGIHEWNVTTKETGVQSIKAILRFSGTENMSTDRMFNMTIIVK